ncbi:hypothetical protein EPN28_02225 [Patescibacteria group bacterium]|nr:MAG: hypothetical protein EPN28_02225 [Patescibacteria group bacterium]
MTKSTIQKIVFTIIFVAIGFGLMQVPFTQLIGSKLKFTLFDFYGPIAGGFLGSVWGMITVLAMQIANWAWHGFNTETATLIRFFPMLFAVLYFARKSRAILAVPVIAMLVFWAHPEGRQAWHFALYWLIPLAAHFFRNKILFARALGTTFTAHAVGGALWIWFVPGMKAAAWIGLIPVVWKERGLMAIGITLSFVVFNFLFSLAAKKIRGLDFLKLHPKYSVK